MILRLVREIHPEYDVPEIEDVDGGRSHLQLLVDCRASALQESYGDWGVRLGLGNTHDLPIFGYERGPFFHALRPVSHETRLRDQKRAP